MPHTYTVYPSGLMIQISCMKKMQCYFPTEKLKKTSFNISSSHFGILTQVEPLNDLKASLCMHFVFTHRAHQQEVFMQSE